MRPWVYEHENTAEDGGLPTQDHPLCLRLGVSPIVAALLTQRGITDPDAARDYMAPKVKELCLPWALPEMDAAADRLARAVREGERVLVFGDYDVDGATGSAALFAVLSALGAPPEVHIPNRNEGYGLGLPRLERAVADGVSVVISVDNGIAALDEAEFLHAQGVDLIVADHHTFGDTLPKACARVHPRLDGTTYPNPNLCGAGVAFKLAWATAERVAGGRVDATLRQCLNACIGYVALGTIADVVSLTGENRTLVRHGLEVLGANPPPGVGALMELTKVNGTPSAMDVSFRLAPRLNAAGRMGDARRAFELLVAPDRETGQRLARDLDRENTRRQDLQRRVYSEACQKVEEVYGEEVKSPGIVVWGDDWPHGVVGIVAAKLTERYHRPALVASVEGEFAKGSGRTVAGIDLLASLEEARGPAKRLGGHAAAVGFTVPTAKLEEFREAFHRGVKEHLGVDPDGPDLDAIEALEPESVQIDAVVRLDDLTTQLVHDLKQLAPFGEGNPEPVFAAQSLVLVGEPGLMGKDGRHVQFRVKHTHNGHKPMRVVAWSHPELWDELRQKAGPRPGGPRSFELAFRPRLNHFRGNTTVELEFVALRYSAIDVPELVS